MEYPNNNIFQFATKELSQDAVICWLVNNFHYPEQDAELYALSVKFLQRLMGEKAPAKIDSVRILPQYNKIDVLLVVNHRIAVIIEDKVWASEHGGQIKNYKDMITMELSAAASREALLGAPVDFSDASIVTVYFKTGFWYDNDMFTGETVDVRVDGESFLNVLKTCRSSHPFFTDYRYRLEHVILQEYKDCRTAFDAENWNACLGTYYGQYLLLDKLFPEHGKGLTDGDRENEIKYIYGGANIGGTPWNEYSFWAGIYLVANEEEKSKLFWRVDGDSNGYYISLRHYDYNAKKDEQHKKHKTKAYNFFCGKVDEILLNHELQALAAHRGYSGGYKESTLLTLYITTNNSHEKANHSIREICHAVDVVTTELSACFPKYNANLEIEKAIL